MIKVCIFDLDGTLCDTIESISGCANRALRECGLKEATPEEYKVFVGDGVEMLIRRLLNNAGDPECEHYDEIYSRYTVLFKEGCLRNVKPYPGIPETLEALKKAGIKLAVLSNKPHANTVSVIQKTFGDGVFDIVLGMSERFPKKPDPSAALYIADEFGAAPEECMYLGDTWTDMATGKAAGMFTAGVLWGFRGAEELTQNGADILIEDAAGIYPVAVGK